MKRYPGVVTALVKNLDDPDGLGENRTPIPVAL